MSEIKNFAQVHEALRQFYGEHAKGPYTLDRMRALMKVLGDPQNSLKVIHIAGTSGKTSTAYYIASLLTQSGHLTGLTVSPHIDEINERVQIGMRPLAEEVFCKDFSEFLDIVHQSEILPSYFELMVAFAYWEFCKLNVEYAVVEVGLGGLLDATNVVSSSHKVCVITDIGLDHTEILGDTLTMIARQKSGIIQPGNNVHMHTQSTEVMEVVRNVCEGKNATLSVASTSDADSISALPLFQRRNFNLALSVVRSLKEVALNAEHIKAAVQTYIPARMEIIRIGDKTIVMDGAHNAQKLTTFFQSLKNQYPDRTMTALVAFTEGDIARLRGGLDVIMSNVSHIIVSSFYTEKDYPKHSVAIQDIINYCHEKNYDNVNSVEDPTKAMQELLKSEDEILLIIGSFYLMNHVRPSIQSLL